MYDKKEHINAGFYVTRVYVFRSQRSLRHRLLSYKLAECVSSLREGNVSLLMEQFLCLLKQSLAINHSCSLHCRRMAPLNITAVARWCARESQLKEKDASL